MENKPKKPIWKRISFWLIIIFVIFPLATTVFTDDNEYETDENVESLQIDSLQLLQQKAERDSIRKARRDSLYKNATPEERKIYDAQEKRRLEYEKKKIERAEKEANFEKRKKDIEKVFKNPVVVNSKHDGSVRQVKEYLKKNLNDPDSYQPVEWSPVSQILESKTYVVVHQYRAKNGFGALMLYKQAFILNLKGQVIEVNDF